MFNIPLKLDLKELTKYSWLRSLFAVTALEALFYLFCLSNIKQRQVTFTNSVIAKANVDNGENFVLPCRLINTIKSRD